MTMARLGFMPLLALFALAACGVIGPDRPGDAVAPPQSPDETATPAWDRGELDPSLRPYLERLETLEAALDERRGEIMELRQSSTNQTEVYFGTVMAIDARLTMGTEANNPVLIGQWNDAQAALDEVARTLVALDRAAIGLGRDFDEAEVLAEAIEQKLLDRRPDDPVGTHAGGPDLRRDIVRLSRAVDRLRSGVDDDIRTLATGLPDQRRTLSDLKLGVQLGRSRAPEMARGADRSGSGITEGPGGDGPVLVIAFDRPQVDFGEPLSRVVSAALEQDPDTAFRLVAVYAPGQDEDNTDVSLAEARQYGRAVSRFIMQMGVPAERLSLYTEQRGGLDGAEIQVYAE